MIGYLQFLRDKVRRKLGVLLFDKYMPPGIKGDVSHIVIVRWDAKLGDSFISSFFFREIRKLSSKIKVTVITTPELASLYLDCFRVDSVIVINKRPSYHAISQAVSKISHVDLVIHLTEVMKMKDLYFLFKLSPANVASLDDDIKRVNVKLSQVTSAMLFQDKYRYILSMLGVKDINSQYIIPAVGRGNVVSECSEIILVNVFGSTKYKSLSHVKAVDLLGVLGNSFPTYRIGILSSPATYAAAEAIVNVCSASNIILLEGVKTIEDATYCVQQSKVVLSVDTAIVHIAVGLEKPLVAIYPRHGELFNQWLPNKTPLVRVLFSASSGMNADMNNVDDKAIIEALSSFLGTAKRAELGMLLR